MTTSVTSGVLPNSRACAFIESAAALEETMRAVMDENGYLFFRALIPIQDVLAVRREILKLCAAGGWLDSSREMMDGVAAREQKPLVEGMPEYFQIYRKILKSPLFYDFPNHAALLGIARKLLGEEVLVHPRRIGRITFPNLESATTPAHQDFHYIRGAVETYSCWVPLGDCPRELGGLAICPGSHKHGFREHTIRLEGAVGGQAVPIDEDQAIWHTGDFNVGDALFFHSYTIHKAMPNKTQNRLRLSTDNRYQKPRAEIHRLSQTTHFELDLDAEE